MSKRRAEKKDGLGSILSYVFSTILFDIIAYTVSIRLGNLVFPNIGYLGFIPGNYLIPLIGPLEYDTFQVWNLALSEGASSFALLVLPLATFVWGVVFHHLLTERKAKRKVRDDLNLALEDINN